MTSAQTASNTDSYKPSLRFFFYPQKHFKHTAFSSRLICIKFTRAEVLNEDDVSDCTTWQSDMIHFHISTAVPKHSMLKSPGADKESDESDPGAQRPL